MGVAEDINLSDLELTSFFFAIALLLVSSQFFGYLFHRFKMPKVIGEIFGGLLLGPTFLGFFFPGAHDWLFNAFPAEGKLISAISWLGLVLLMFVSGFAIQKSYDKRDKTITIAILLGATVIPFIAGWLAPSFYDFSPFMGPKGNMLAMQIVIAIAIAVTSIPVISKIFIDLNIIDTRFAKIVLAAATVHDVILWAALAIATGLVSAGAPSLGGIMWSVLVTIAFFALALTLVPRLIKFGSDSGSDVLAKSSASGYILLICFLFAAIASFLNVNIAFGAFLAGIVVGMAPKEKFEKEKGHVREISLAFFVPLYFAIVGLKLDLVRHFDPVFFLFFLAFSTILQIASVIFAAKLIKKDWLSSFNLAIAMNAKGGPGIVLATIAFDLGIINQAFFVTLVLVAIITSLMAGSWLGHVLSKGLPLLKD